MPPGAATMIALHLRHPGEPTAGKAGIYFTTDAAAARRAAAAWTWR